MSRIPCLGFYVEMVNVRKRMFGEQTRMLEELTRIGHELDVSVIVLPPGYAKTGVHWRYDIQHGDWVQGSVSIPDIVIRRSGTFSASSMQFLNQDLKLFSSRHILHTLPLRCSNKWILFKTLSASNSIRKYLPYTQLVTTAEQVYSIATRRKDVYVKPLAGAQGACIYRLKLDSDNRLGAVWERRLVSRDTERRTNLFRPTTEVFDQKFSEQNDFSKFWSKTKLQKCVIQDTVRLQRNEEDCPYDFRWLVQSSDKPKIVARVARVGQKYGITTNIHTGGTAVSAEEVFSHYGDAKRRTIIAEMDDIALSVVQILVQEFGPFAEVGIDLAVDTKDKIFMFEVNPTPGRRMLRALSPTVREMSLRALIEYASRAIRYQDL